MGEEAMPVVRARDRVPGPVGGLGVDEDDPSVRVAVVGVRPHVPVALGRVGARPRLLEPGVLGRGVVHDHVGDHADTPRVSGVDQLLDIVDGAVVGVDAGEVGDVVAPVAQRRLVEREQPDAVDPEPLEVVELLGDAAHVSRAVSVGIEEAPDVDLVEHGTLEPQRLGLEPLPGLSLTGALGGGLRGHVVPAIGRDQVREGRWAYAHACTRMTCAWRTPGSRRM